MKLRMLDMEKNKNLIIAINDVEWLQLRFCKLNKLYKTSL